MKNYNFCFYGYVNNPVVRLLQNGGLAITDFIQERKASARFSLFLGFGTPIPKTGFVLNCINGF